VKEIQRLVDFTNNGYKNLVLGFLTSDKRNDVLTILRKYLPEIVVGVG
jgi:hypothetical protein